MKSSACARKPLRVTGLRDPDGKEAQPTTSSNPADPASYSSFENYAQMNVPLTNEELVIRWNKAHPEAPQPVHTPTGFAPPTPPPAKKAPPPVHPAAPPTNEPQTQERSKHDGGGFGVGDLLAGIVAVFSPTSVSGVYHPQTPSSLPAITDFHGPAVRGANAATKEIITKGLEAAQAVQLIGELAVGAAVKQAVTKLAPSGPSQEALLEAARASGKVIGEGVLGQKTGKMAYIVEQVSKLHLSQAEAVAATESAVAALKLRTVTVTVGKDVVVASVVLGAGKPVLVVNAAGKVVQATADISVEGGKVIITNIVKP